MDHMEDRGFAEDNLSPEERLAIQALLELGWVRGRHLALWGLKRRRSTVAYSSCNYGDKHVPAAGEVKAARRSPKTPLWWSGNERFSASATASPSSDSAPGSRPCDLTLGPNLKSKVERKLGVHNPSNGKGPKKKTLAELKELFIGLSLEKEEMEKEKEKLFNSFQSLTDENKLLKQKLELKLGKKRQQQLSTEFPTISSNLASIPHDALESSSHAFALPDLNIPAEDVEDLSNNMSFDIDNQVLQVNSKAVVAAKARKYRIECLRLKHSQSVKRRHSHSQ